MNSSVELSKMDKLVKVSIYLLEPASRLCPYIEDKDVTYIVILTENCVSYPEQVIRVIMNLWRLSWLEKTFWRVVGDGAARLKTAFNVVEKLMKTLALLKRSTDITMLLGSRIKSAQVFNILGIGYLIAICISNFV